MNKKLLIISILVVGMFLVTFSSIETYSLYKKDFKPVNVEVNAAGFKPDIKITNILSGKIKPKEDGQVLATIEVKKSSETNVNVEYDIKVIGSGELYKNNDFKISLNEGNLLSLKNTPTFPLTNQSFEKNIVIHWPKDGNEFKISNDLLNEKGNIKIIVTAKQKN